MPSPSSKARPDRDRDRGSPTTPSTRSRSAVPRSGCVPPGCCSSTHWTRPTSTPCPGDPCRAARPRSIGLAGGEAMQAAVHAVEVACTIKGSDAVRGRSPLAAQPSRHRHDAHARRLLVDRHPAARTPDRRHPDHGLPAAHRARSEQRAAPQANAGAGASAPIATSVASASSSPAPAGGHATTRCAPTARRVGRCAAGAHASKRRCARHDATTPLARRNASTVAAICAAVPGSAGAMSAAARSRPSATNLSTPASASAGSPRRSSAAARSSSPAISGPGGEVEVHGAPVVVGPDLLVGLERLGVRGARADDVTRRRRQAADGLADPGGEQRAPGDGGDLLSLVDRDARLVEIAGVDRADGPAGEAGRQALVVADGRGRPRRPRRDGERRCA